MSYWVLAVNGTVVPRTTVSRVTNLEAQPDENKSRIAALDKTIQERLNNESHIIVEGGKGESKDWSEYTFDRNPDFQEEFKNIVSNEEVSEAENEFLPDVYDNTYLTMDLAPPKRGEPDPQFTRVTKSLHDVNGLPIGKASDNPVLDTRMYEVEYADGKKSASFSNLISENMFAQIYEEVNRHVLMDETNDHQFG